MKWICTNIETQLILHCGLTHLLLMRRLIFQILDDGGFEITCTRQFETFHLFFNLTGNVVKLLLAALDFSFPLKKWTV